MIIPRSFDQEVLECQDCGDIVKELSNEETQEVAREPYKFIVYCHICIKDRRIDSRRSPLLMVIEGER